MDDNTVICFKERAGCPGGGKGILVGYNFSFTLATNFNGAICCKASENYDERCKMPEPVGHTEQAHNGHNGDM